MKESATQPVPVLGRELVWVGLLAVLGAAIRLVQWEPAGVSHFDEGVYLLWAQTGDYVAKEFYAPPLFPWLVRILSGGIWAADSAALALNCLVTAASVVLIWWVTRRWYGPIAGWCAAPLPAFSGFHIAFARMALTDVLFTFLFVAGVWLASEALFPIAVARSRVRWPALIAAVIACAAALYTKYNGLLVLAIVIAATAACLALCRVSARPPTFELATGLAVLVLMSLLLYAPWFWHVHSRFGYDALWAHHRGYASGLAAWPDHLATLFAFEWTLGRQVGFIALVSGALGSVAMVRPAAWSRVWICGAVLVGLGFGLGDAFGWTLGGLAVAWFARTRRSCVVMHLVWLGVLIALTPLYRPYPRLMLPLVAAGWIAAGALLGVVVARWGEARRSDSMPGGGHFAGAVSVIGALCAGLVHAKPYFDLSVGARSLASACDVMGGRMPPGSRTAAVVRPPVLYHLRNAPLDLVDSGSEGSLRDLTNRYGWLLVDQALARDNAPLTTWLDSAGNRLRLVSSVPYRPGVSVMLDDFGRGYLARGFGDQAGSTYRLELYRLDSMR